MQSAIFGVAFLGNEKIESYEWLFQTLLGTMGGKSSRVKTIITYEDDSMYSTIKKCSPRYNS
jgi:hypothetical protein